MKCSFCGKDLREDAKFCTECGNKVTVTAAKETKKEAETVKPITVNSTEVPISNSKGTASLVLGIISLFVGGLFLPIPIVGLILGIAQKGKGGTKIAGIILNAISLLISIIAWIFIILIIVVAYNSDTTYYESMEENTGDSDIIIKDDEYDEYYGNIEDFGGLEQYYRQYFDID